MGLLLILAPLLAGAAPDEPVEFDPETVLKRIEAERALIESATSVAAEENPQAAWAVLAGDFRNASDRGHMGWRAASVAGALRNQSFYVEADAFARYALEQDWTLLDGLSSDEEKDEIRYWFAWLAARMVGENQRALAALRGVRTGVRPESAPLLEELEAAERAFPSD